MTYLQSGELLAPTSLHTAAGEGTPVGIRELRAPDWEAVRSIYAAGIATGQATLEKEPPSWEAFDTGRLPGHRLVAADGQLILGWAAVSAVSAREVYRGVVEHSIYVAPGARGRGVGRILLAALIQSTEAGGIWTIQSSIFPENTASLALHEQLGFRIIGTRERIARMSHGPNADRWQNTLLLERRSSVVGTD